MLEERTLYSLDDVTLVASPVSEVRHRSDCNIYDDLGQLPIFTAPMDMVVCKENMELFVKNNIIPILPRTYSIEERLEYSTKYWVAFSLEEFDTYFVNDNDVIKDYKYYRVLIDIANGHLESLHDSIALAKAKAQQANYVLEIMAGNVANPDTYAELAECGADYVRCSVGSGQCCITSSNTSVHYPMASLIADCYELKCKNHYETKIIADGGISSYSKAIKALALGADYVMIGTTLAKCFESAGEFVNAETDMRDTIEGFNLSDWNSKRFNDELSEKDKKKFISKYHPQKIIYGMSTKRAQMKIAKAQGKTDVRLKTSEGIERTINVEYTLSQWTENFCDYLRSAMSYCNAFNLIDFKENSYLVLLSEGAKKSINK